MNDLLCDQFQDNVDEVLTRHKSVLDIMTKLQEADARVNRAITKAVTRCGCIEIHAVKQNLNEEESMDEYRKHMETHMKGKLCASCREIVEKELGTNMFYIAALCNAMDISLYDVMLKEYKKIETLGVYNMY